MLLPLALWLPMVVAEAWPEPYSPYSKPGSLGQAHGNDQADVSAEADAMNHPGMDGTSKACRYDDGPGWSDCDPFELIRYRVLRLIHGGSQCEEMKNITKHCTPHDFPFGTHWLIQEHRKCIAELNRLKSMISDLHKFIETLHAKGKELFAAYLKLKQKLELLQVELQKIKVDGAHQQEVLDKLKKEIEEWKVKARELQTQIDEIKAKFHDLQSEEHELKLKNSQMENDINVLTKENEGTTMKIDKITRDNDELRRRITELEHTAEKVGELRVEKNKFEGKLDRLKEYLEKLKDALAEQRIQNLKKNMPDFETPIDTKDTHVDLSMEMFIVHNKTNLYQPTYPPIYYSTEAPYYPTKHKQAKCLISYYGVTNETCWYESEGQRSEDSYVDALGHHLVEAHWKYFTIDVEDQAECDKASHLHYEFLINRCSPKHYLPVLSIFRPSEEEKECGTHVYPKVNQNQQNQCWITFLGAHGHCEAHNEKFPLYNTDDTPEGYSAGSGQNQAACLARAQWWMKFCDTPVIATHIPSGVSSTWHNDWIMHDSHGGRMFEESEDAKNNINPDSLNPHGPVKASPSEFKSQADKTPDYHDSPEYRKSLHLQGEEKEQLLSQLRSRLGMSQAAGQVSQDVQHHGGVDTGSMNGAVQASSQFSAQSQSSDFQAQSSSQQQSGFQSQSQFQQSSNSGYESYTEAQTTYSEQPTETTTPYSTETTTAYSPETTTTYEETTTQYQTEAYSSYEPPKYEGYGGYGASQGGAGQPGAGQGGVGTGSDTETHDVNEHVPETSYKYTLLKK